MQLSFRAGAVAVLAVLAAALPPAYVWMRGGAADPAPVVRIADFGAESPSGDARRITEWIAASRDNGNAPFVIVDKKAARLLIFDANARLRASSPILLGEQRGDDMPPDLGVRAVTDVRVEEKTTPAGRFVPVLGRNLRDEEVIWISYADRVSMHPVLTTNPNERRLERLAVGTPEEMRISAGCVNVPADFYAVQLLPAFTGQRSVVYILPELKTLEEVFGIPGAVES